MDAPKLPPRRGRPTKEAIALRGDPEKIAALRASRVDFVADMMRKLQFRPGATNEYLAEQWGLSRHAMSKIAVEASRIVRAEYAQNDLTMAMGLTALDHVLADALASGDRKSALRAVELWVQVTGAGAATKVQVSADIESMTPAQLAARKQEILARLMGKDIEVREVSGDDDAAR